ncbi:Glycine cleavage system H protein [hydrothermal vent metagenome]|uniref:Glycine cleavage system H protein n=1 Tax=hydrothermal vent metagenome TaxID=652676 RepID=A0A3B0Y5Z5_9ZZZZ
MSNVPVDLKYTHSDEWIRVNNDGTILMGITDYAQNALGDMVFVEMQEAGQTLEVDQECGVVESVKAASEVNMPVSGEIIEVNAAVEASPEVINTDPYGDGWLMKMKPVDTGSLDGLMDSVAYEAKLAASDH